MTLKSKFENELNLSLMKTFKCLGFKQNDKKKWRFEKKSNKTIDFVSIRPSNPKEREFLYYVITGLRQLKTIDNFFVGYLKQLEIKIGILYTIAITPENDSELRFKKVKISIKPNESIYNLVEDCSKQLENIYSTLILPKLEEKSDVQVLNQEFNTPFSKTMQGTINWYRKLIVAKLAGNEDFEQIYKYAIQNYESWILNEQRTKYKNKYTLQLLGLKQIYEDLEKVEPLQNSYLGDNRLHYL